MTRTTEVGVKLAYCPCFESLPFWHIRRYNLSPLLSRSFSRLNSKGVVYDLMTHQLRATTKPTERCAMACRQTGCIPASGTCGGRSPVIGHNGTVRDVLGTPAAQGVVLTTGFSAGSTIQTPGDTAAGIAATGDGSTEDGSIREATIQQQTDRSELPPIPSPNEASNLC